MARNTAFQTPAREPLRADPNLKLDDRHTRGPFSFLNPTATVLLPSHNPPEQPERQSKEHGTRPGFAAGREIAYQWRSRDNRKGRHTLLVTPEIAASDQYRTPSPSSAWHTVLTGIIRMATYYPYWDISWWVAILFTLGSVIWVVNAFFVWQPLVDPSTEFPGEILVAGGWSAFVGATVFEIGSVLLMIEAVNENRTGCFGWAIDKAIGDAEREYWSVGPATECQHHHANKRNFVGKGAADACPDAGAPIARSWQWFPSWHDLTTHYIRELGFLACFFQLLGATIFWISGFTAIPQIQDALTTHAALDGAYWAPQIVGGAGFVVSGTLFMLETQKKWYLPAWGVLGWHIGLWNLIGAIGFTLCGALGLAYASSGAQFEASLATFWGSWAFLIGSVVQWYESLDTHPVKVVPRSHLAEQTGT